jgi:hypothetical protein
VAVPRWSSRRTPGPITTDVCCRQNRRSSFAQHRHWWLWVPAQGRDDAITFRRNTCVFPDSIFKPSIPSLRAKQKQSRSCFCDAQRCATTSRHTRECGYPVRCGFSFQHRRLGILDHPLSRMMTTESVARSRSSNALPRSRGTKRPSHARTIRPQISEGAGKAGCSAHPRPRVQSVESTRVRHHRFAGTPGLPCAMVLTVSSALSLVTGRSCHHRPRENLLPENLTPASGRQDHTTSPSASQARSSMRYSRPPHPAPRP